MTYDFKLSCTLPASSEAVYDAWLDSAAHTAMTGGEAKIVKRVGGAHSAWDGCITGKTVELNPGKRIVQSWRTNRCGDDPDSTINVELSPTKTGTLLRLTHSGVPEGHLSDENRGWQDNYFAPMKAHFAGAKTKRRLGKGPRTA
jgi:activator of HSP90 ATPase